MGDEIGLSEDELAVLRRALAGPVCDPDPSVRQLCLNLQSRRFLQRAGIASQANGWTGSPHAFVLAQAGWCWLKSERAPVGVRRRR